MKYISIGRSCQVAYQIRRFFNNNDSYFFDWLITDVNCVDRVLNEFDENKFLTDIELCADGLRVLDKHTGIQIQHEFKTNSQGIHDVSVLRDELEIKKVKSKFLYLRNKLLNLLKTSSDEKIVFVWLDWANQGDFICKRAKSKIEKIISHLENNEQIYFLILSAEVSRDEFFDNGAILRISSINERTKVSEKWKGDDASWSRAFNVFSERYNSL